MVSVPATQSTEIQLPREYPERRSSSESRCGDADRLRWRLHDGIGAVERARDARLR